MVLKVSKSKIGSILILFLVLQNFDIYAQFQSGQMQKHKEAATKKAMGFTLKDVPSPLKENLYQEPVSRFVKEYQSYVRTSYNATIDQSKPKKDTAVYTINDHIMAIKNSIDVPNTYDFDFSQYVRFTDWNGKYYFLTIHHSKRKDIGAIEFLDSVMTRHTLIVDNESKITVLMSINRKKELSMRVIPQNQVEGVKNDNSLRTKLEPLIPIVKSSSKATDNEKMFLGQKTRTVKIGGNWNHAQLTFSNGYYQPSKSLFDTFGDWLPVQQGYHAEMIGKEPILFETSSTYGDKPFYNSTWKTVKLSIKPIVITLQNLKIE